MRDGVDRRRGLGGGDRRRRRRRVRRAAELPRRGRGLEPLIAAAREHGALVGLQRRPDRARHPRAAGRSSAWTSASVRARALGNRLDFGGPSFGFFAAREEHLRRMPGRIAGETRDLDGRRGFVLTLQTREQHIRREKATSNICTAQALNALAGVVYLAWLGGAGCVELAELLVRRTAYARERWPRSTASAPLHDAARRARVRRLARPAGLTASVRRVIARCARRARQPGLPARARATPSIPDGLLVAITEQRSRADIDRLADVLGRALAAERAAAAPGARRMAFGPARADAAVTIFEEGARGRRAFAAPALDVPERPLDELIPRAPAPQRAGAAAGGLRARARAPLRATLAAQLRPGLRLLPARLVHDEAQPAAARARRRAARARPAAPADRPSARAGRARADVGARARARRRSPGCRTSRCSPRPARTASSRACC